MKNGIGVLGLILAAANILTAADKPKPATDALDQAKAMAELQQKLLKQFDLNQDGVLSGPEKLAAQEAMAKHGLTGAAMLPGGPAGSAEFLKRFDRNGDGKLDDGEKLAAQAAWNRLRGGDAKPGGGPTTVGPPGGGAPPTAPAPADAKGKNDGKEDKVNPLVKRFDKDGDGKLNEEEKAAAQAALKKKKAPK